MEFGENGSVVTEQTPENTNTYEKPPSSHGYEEGPRSVLGLYHAMRIGLVAYIVTEVLWQLLLSAYLVFPGALPDYMFAQTDADTNYVVTAGYGYTLVTIVAFFFSCRFVYRAMRNLHTIQSPVAETSPAWAVGYYFIPFVNLVMPANAMSQIYHGTYRAAGEKSRHASPIPVWWTCWLLAGIVESITDRLPVVGVSAFALYALSGAFGIIAAVALIRLGGRVAVRQEQFKHGGIAHIFD